MGNVTLDQIYNFAGWCIGFVSATLVIVRAVKTAIANSFKPIDKKIDTVDLNATKNFLVRCIADIDRHGIDDVTRLRFYEQYEHYSKPKSEGGLGGNSYIKDEVERLKKEGKL